MSEGLPGDVVAAHDEVTFIDYQDFCVVAGVALGPPDLAAEALEFARCFAVLLAQLDFRVEVIEKNIYLDFARPGVLQREKNCVDDGILFVERILKAKCTNKNRVLGVIDKLQKFSLKFLRMVKEHLNAAVFVRVKNFIARHADMVPRPAAASK